MKLLWILLILAVGIADGSQTKLNPAIDINWTKNVGDQIHGVTNGTSAQDVATYSQVVDLSFGDSIVTIGPYAYNDYVVNSTYFINDAINDSLDDGNYNIQLESYTYLQDGPIVFDVPSFKLTGTGNWNTWIKAVGCTNVTTQIIIGPASGTEVSQFLISDVLIYRDRDGDPIAGTTGVIYRTGAPYHVWKQTMERVWILGSEKDLVLGSTTTGVSGFTARDCTFGPSAGNYFYDTSPVVIECSIQTLFDNCNTFFYTETGFLVGNNVSNDVTFINCYANGWDVGKYGFQIQNGMVVTLVRCGAEANINADLAIFGGDGHTISESFFGGAGPGSKTGHSMIVSPVYGDITGTTITGSHFSYTNGIDGAHYGQATIEMYDTSPSYFMSWTGLVNCDIMDTGNGAINLTNVFSTQITNCRMPNFHAAYSIGTSQNSVININGTLAADHVLSNNLLQGHKYGISVTDSASAISITGNRVAGVASSGDAVHITTSGSATVTDDHNAWHA